MSLAQDNSPQQGNIPYTGPALPRHDWTRDQVRGLFALPFPELMFRAAQTHRENFDPAEVQISTLLAIKTGGCPEDCAYCPQAARYDTGVTAEKLMRLDDVLKEAAGGKAGGAQRVRLHRMPGAGGAGGEGEVVIMGPGQFFNGGIDGDAQARLAIERQCAADQLRLDAGEDIRQPLDDAHLGAERGEDRGELAADDAAADDRQSFRECRECQDAIGRDDAGEAEAGNRDRGGGGARSARAPVTHPAPRRFGTAQSAMSRPANCRPD